MTTRMTISMLRMAAAAILLRAHLASALRMASRSASRSAAVVVDSHPAGAVRGDNNMKNERNHSGGKTRKKIDKSDQFHGRLAVRAGKKSYAQKPNLKKYCARVTGSACAETDRHAWAASSWA